MRKLVEKKERRSLRREKKNRATERKKGDEIESIRDLSRKIEGVRLSALTVSIYVPSFSNSIYSFIGNESKYTFSRGLKRARHTGVPRIGNKITRRIKVSKNQRIQEKRRINDAQHHCMAEKEKEKKSNSVENEYHSRSPCFLLVI